MPRFTTPNRLIGADDPWWGRYQIREGVTVVRDGLSWRTLPGPTADELAGLEDGVGYFRGGYVYQVSPEVGQELEEAGFPVDMGAGYGYGGYGDEEYGD